MSLNTLQMKPNKGFLQLRQRIDPVTKKCHAGPAAVHFISFEGTKCPLQDCHNVTTNVKVLFFILSSIDCEKLGTYIHV